MKSVVWLWQAIMVAPLLCSFLASSKVIALNPSPPFCGAGTLAAGDAEQNATIMNKDSKDDSTFRIMKCLLSNFERSIQLPNQIAGMTAD
jgi:hypothetical protein